MKSKTCPTFAALGLAVSLVAGPGLAQGSAAPQGPRTLTIDRQAIWRDSKVGQDIQRQVDAYMAGEQKEFGPQADALRKEFAAIQQEPPGVRDQKLKAFRVRQADFQQKVQSYELLIRGGEFKARQQLEQTLGPILDTIMRERGADMVVENQVVVRSIGDPDITKPVLQQLDRKLSRLKLELVNPPANPTRG